jgi:hypothetical protein
MQKKNSLHQIEDMPHNPPSSPCLITGEIIVFELSRELFDDFGEETGDTHVEDGSRFEEDDFFSNLSRNLLSCSSSANI